MRTRNWLLATLLVATCIGGAAWGIANLKSGPPVREGSSLRPSGQLASASKIPIPRDPIPSAVVALDAGQAQQDQNPGPPPDWEALQQLNDAMAAVVAARQQLRTIESALATTRASAVNREYGLVSAEVAAIEADNAIANSDRLYRQGMDSELHHDRTLALHRAAQRQLDAEQSRAGLLAGSIDELEAERLDARAALHEAMQKRRVAETAAHNRGVVDGAATGTAKPGQ